MTIGEKAIALMAWTGLCVWIGWLFCFQSSGEDPRLCSLPELPLNSALSWVDPALLFEKGWSAEEGTHRWTGGQTAELRFKLGKKPAGPFNVSLVIDILHVIDRQPVIMQLNGHQLGMTTFSGKSLSAALTVPTEALSWEGINHLVMNLPKARPPGTHDPRILGIALKSFTLKLASLTAY